jgi:hypothetical protein
VKSRHLILGVALLVTAGFAFLPGSEEETEVVAPVARGERAAHPPSPPAPALPAAQAGRPAFAPEAGADLFPAQSFRPPPARVRVETPPPPPPMAPPLPFAYVGAWTEAGVETVFLAQGERVLSVRAGAALPGGWRLDAVAPDSLQFTYESLNQQRTLRIAP